MSELRFTVVVPTKNRKAVAVDLVSYLRRDLGWECPVILVDQSEDGGAELERSLEQEAFRDVTLRHHDKVGASAARNEGARLADTKWLIFLDDDVRPVRHYLSDLERFIRDNPWADVIQTALEDDASWERYRNDESGYLEERQSRPRRREDFPVQWDGVMRLTSSPWCNYEVFTIGLGSGSFAVSKAVFEAAGGFDEQVVGGFGDDRDFGLRLWWHGYRVVQIPHVFAFHLRYTEGGNRPSAVSRASVLDPHPPIGLFYLYLKWFPGAPYRRVVVVSFVRCWRRPWRSIPIRLIRLRRSLLAARTRIEQGSIYLSEPLTRDAFVASRSLSGDCHVGAAIANGPHHTGEERQ